LLTSHDNKVAFLLTLSAVIGRDACSHILCPVTKDGGTSVHLHAT